MASAARLLATAVFAGGCAYNPAQPESSYVDLPADTHIELKDTPFFPQNKYQCGPAALATVLQQTHLTVTPEELVPEVYLPDRRGSLQSEMIATVRRHGRMPYVIEPGLAALVQHLRDRYPVLVLQNLGVDFLPVWHYAVVIGYSSYEKEFVLRSGRSRRLTMSVDRFKTSWDAGGNWGLIVLDPNARPKNLDAHHYLKTVSQLEELEKMDTALSAYTSAVAEWPDNPIAWFGLGNAYYHQRSFDQALVAYRHVISLKPGYPPAVNNLAITYAELGQFVEALQLVDSELDKQVAGSDMFRILTDTRQDIIDRQARFNGQVK